MEVQRSRSYQQAFNPLFTTQFSNPTNRSAIERRMKSRVVQQSDDEDDEAVNPERAANMDGSDDELEEDIKDSRKSGIHNSIPKGNSIFPTGQIGL
jgi:hypothetical protein